MSIRTHAKRPQPARWHRRSLRLVAAAALLMPLLSAGAVIAEEIPPAAAIEAATIWQQRCSTCHGPGGKGDGPAGAALNPKPRDFSLADWQKSVTDERLQKVIVEGGPAVGLSLLMVPNPDLTAKPDVIKALIAHVRGFAGK